METMMPEMTEGSEGSEEVAEQSPFADAISQVESYIQSPELVTPETLAELRDKLVAIQADVEGTNESPEGSMSAALTEAV